MARQCERSAGASSQRRRRGALMGVYGAQQVVEPARV